MKARFQRALALLLVLVLTLGCIPAVSAVQPNEPVFYFATASLRALPALN